VRLILSSASSDLRRKAPPANRTRSLVVAKLNL
jgi:hypothetical protein